MSWGATPRHWTWIKHPKYQNRSISRFVDETRGKAFFWLHAEVNRRSNGVSCSFWRGDCAVFRRTTKEVALRLALGNIQVVESSSFFGFCWLKSFWNRCVICEYIQIVVDSWQWFLLLVFSVVNTSLSFEKNLQKTSWLARSFCWRNPFVGMET